MFHSARLENATLSLLHAHDLAFTVYAHSHSEIQDVAVQHFSSRQISAEP